MLARQVRRAGPDRLRLCLSVPFVARRTKRDLSALFQWNRSPMLYRVLDRFVLAAAAFDVRYQTQTTDPGAPWPVYARNQAKAGAPAMMSCVALAGAQ